VPRRIPRRLRVLAIVIVALGAGCGPFGYLKKVARDASRAVGDAEKVGAEKLAPYEYWGAVSYLEQAKVLMAYSEYERSFDYGVRAKQLAEEAKKKAEKREAGKMRETAEDDAAKKPDPNAKKPGKGDAKAGGKVEGGGKAGGGK
jgi:hypothetical protein